MISCDSKTKCSAALLLLFAGCVTIDPQNAGSLSVPDLCQIATGNGYVANSEQAKAAARAELQRRNLFTYQEFMGIQSGYVQIGMSERAGVCALGGYPNDVNTTINALGRSKQYVFGDFTTGPVRYLYTVNGKVTAFQD